MIVPTLAIGMTDRRPTGIARHERPTPRYRRCELELQGSYSVRRFRIRDGKRSAFVAKGFFMAIQKRDAFTSTEDSAVQLMVPDCAEMMERFQRMLDFGKSG